jgi:hypothetical protein
VASCVYANIILNLSRRKRTIIVQRREQQGDDVVEILGKADTRIYPYDCIREKQLNLSEGYPGLTYAQPTTATLPVVFQDDQMAIGA